jgi:hypothetical protein
LFFILTIFNGLKFTVLDIKYNYSSAKETAKFITKNIDKDSSMLITSNVPHCMALVYYLDGEIYSAAKRDYVKYVVWDESLTHILSDEGWTHYIEGLKEQKKLYVIIPTFVVPGYENIGHLEKTQGKSFKLIYESPPAIVKFEGFRVYEYIGK